ncbi:hypothetical protein [Parabacteroides sp. Marseille-P3160]|uniref:hypothetical protein n=1 Tax=Parabacteroides sp. Marseille-P3160 TaxID=1917887 RepID=UPI0009B9767F|nr:hypothetical protein [Parabacteroides sp. Marseille-P3160]
MKLFFTFIILTIPFLSVWGQSKVKYSYDNAGNRIKRKIIVSTKSAPESSTEPEYYSEILSEKEFRIYPNPTTGYLKVEVNGWEETDKGTITLYTLSGQQILRGL